MGYKAFIKYKAYFFKDHVIFDQSHEQAVELCLGDNSWPDGLQTGTEKMRKGEISKIRIKKLHGFGRPLRVDELRFPPKYSEGPGRDRLVSETIIYEVELVDF
jgi:FKBP-type peptidyl-prolyl cis-trans isomerase 2